MKPVIPAFLLLVASVRLFAQEPWCFSQQCQQLQVPTFQGAPQGTLFKPSINWPLYEPVQPLPPSPTTKQFFNYSFSERGLQNPFTKLTSKEASSQVTAETPNRTPIPVQRGSSVSPHFSSDGSRGFASGAQGFQATGPRSR